MYYCQGSPPKMADASKVKALMPAKDTLVRSCMAGAILALAATFAVTVAPNTGHFIVGALSFPVGFSALCLLGFDFFDRCTHARPSRQTLELGHEIALAQLGPGLRR